MEFPVKLTDQVTAPSRAMASGLAQAAHNAALLEKQMSALQKSAVKASATGDVAGMKKIQAQYKGIGAEVQRLHGQFPQIAAARAEHEKYTNAIKQHEAALKKAKAEEASFQESLTAITSKVKIAAAAILALAVALGSLLIKGATMVLDATEKFEKLTATMNALSGGAGEKVIATLDGLTASLGMTREQLAPLAEQLLAMGVPVSKLAGQLKTLATIQAIGINGGTEAYLGLLKKLEGQTKVSGKSLADLYKTGVNVNEIAKKLGMTTKQLQAALKAGTLDVNKFKTALSAAIAEKGASALEAQARSLTAQIALFHENIKKLFELKDDPAVKGFLNAFKDLLSIVDQSTQSGKALHFLIKQLFDGLFTVASKVLPYVKVFLLGMIVAALRFYIALKPAVAEFKKLMGTHSNKDLLNFFATLGKLAITTGPALNVAVRSLVLFMRILEGLLALRAKLSGGGKGVGGSFVDGIVQGITANIGAAIAATNALGKGMMDAIKGVLGIHSPSAEMRKLGAHAATGFTQGVAAANDNVMSAGAGLGVSVAGGAAGGAAKAPAGGATNTFQIEIHVGGGGKPEETRAAVLDGLADAFERLGITRATVFAA